MPHERAAAPPAYALQFVEFDDQGWLFPGGSDPAHAETETNWAIDDITAPLQADKKVVSFVCVHGWKHSACENNCKVQRFRASLHSRAELAGFPFSPSAAFSAARIAPRKRQRSLSAPTSS